MSTGDQDVVVKGLRPKTLAEYIGQAQIKNTLRLFLDAIKSRGKASEHLLFYGPPGIGKTTMAYIVANELQGELKITSGAAIQRSGDLAAILTNLKDNDVLFIDEIHRLPKPVEEVLYPAMEDYALDIVVGKGPAARAMRLPVARIVIVAATTKLALLSAPLRDRFGILLRLNYYSDDELVDIINRSCTLLKVGITTSAARRIAQRARKTPRIANRIIKRAKDMVEVHKYHTIDDVVLDELFSLLEIDTVGLNNIDIQYLDLLATRFANTPVGISTIATSLSEDRQTVEEYIEPYLLQLGFIKKTPRGRVLTPAALHHLGKDTLG